MATIDELFKQGHTKVRLEHWAMPDDYIEIYDAGDGHMGPWLSFYSKMNEVVGNENPVKIPIWNADKDTRYVPYVEKTA